MWRVGWAEWGGGRAREQDTPAEDVLLAQLSTLVRGLWWEYERIYSGNIVEIEWVELGY